MNNLGFTGSYDPRKIFDPSQMAPVGGGGGTMGFDPAGVYGDPGAAAPYASGYATYGGGEDPMAIMPEPGRGPQFAKAPKKKSKLRGKAKAGLEGFAAATAAPEPIQHHRFGNMSGLLGG